VTAGATPEMPTVRTDCVSGERLRWMASVTFCGVLPAVVLVLVFVSAVGDGTQGMDFRQFYRGADAILDGANLYPVDGASLIASARPYVYPPFPAILAVPLTLLSIDDAALLAMAATLLTVPAILWLLGVRDWRCYGIAFLWPPVISGIQTSNPTLWFALAAALAWRLRNRVGLAGAIVGLTLAVKFVLWPLLVWLVATRRFAAAAIACATGCVLLVGSWAAIGFVGFLDYPGLLRRLQDTVGDDAYTVRMLALDLGASDSVARAIWLAIGVALLVALALAARRGDGLRAFILAIGAALALSPLVWLHYFALLLVVVALARPSLGLIWFVPLVMLGSPGTGNPTFTETAVALLAAAVTLALALRTPGARVSPVVEPTSSPAPARSA
jgi:glycosyl transferase family 87